MLSLILSWIFRIGLALTVIGGIIDMVVQVQQKPITIYSRPDRNMTLGQPGLQLNAYRTSTNERPAPDTLISYSSVDTITGNRSSFGNTSSRSSLNSNTKKTLDSIVSACIQKGEVIKLDTQISIMQYMIPGSSSMSVGYVGSISWDSLPDGRFIRVERTYDELHKQVEGIRRDTFTGKREMLMFDFTHNKRNDYKIVQDGPASETLRLQPTNRTQYIIFILYRLVTWFFTAWLLLTISRLFSNFYNRHYFSLANIKLLRIMGLCLLIPQLLYTVMYWGLLTKIQPAKFMIAGSHDVKLLNQYQFVSETDWTLVFLGLALLILSYIFKDGLSLKEDHDLSI